MRHRELLNDSDRPKVETKCHPCKCGDSVYKVCFKQNTKTETIHIFCCKCEIVPNLGCMEICTPTCLCDCLARAEHSNFNLLTLGERKCFTLEEARLIAAELQNRGDNVCGVCISVISHNRW